MQLPTGPLGVVGSANIDLSFHTQRFPQPGETLSGKSFHRGFGGKGANQAVMASRLGTPVWMAARVGQDSFGKEILDNFRHHGIDTRHVLVDNTDGTGVAAILVDEAAQNCILLVPGANNRLNPDDVYNLAPAIAHSSLVLCQLEIPVDTTLEVFRVARSAGVKTLLNPAPGVSLPPELLSLTDICIPNENELQILTGKGVDTLEEIIIAAHHLKSTGISHLLVTLGSRGVLHVGADRETHIRGISVKAVDSSGAGDAFIGSFASYLVAGFSLLDAAHRANIVAALSVQRPGTQSSFPDRAEVDAALGV